MKQKIELIKDFEQTKKVVEILREIRKTEEIVENFKQDIQQLEICSIFINPFQFKFIIVQLHL